MIRILWRERLLVALPIAIGSMIAGWTPSPAATLTVGKAAPNADPIIPVNVGDKLGMFKKHGLDLTIVDFTGGSKMTQAMAAGSIDIGVGAGTEMALVAKGAPMTAICETAGPPSFLSIGAPWDSPIRSLEQLKGKRIGASTAGSLTDYTGKENITDDFRGQHSGSRRCLFEFLLQRFDQSGLICVELALSAQALRNLHGT
jgi:ABC-type nitrate/sulfonate/bicarbonate transport system substrate-binding protein